MTNRLTLVALGVADLERAAAFYTAVGFERPPAPDGIVLLRTVGSVIVLCPWSELAEDVGVDPAGTGFRGVTLASNQDSREEVDAAYDVWLAAGAVEVKRPAATPWGGYSSYLADLDGHLWELAHNPYLHLDADGRLLAHD